MRIEKDGIQLVIKVKSDSVTTVRKSQSVLNTVFELYVDILTYRAVEDGATRGVVPRGVGAGAARARVFEGVDGVLLARGANPIVCGVAALRTGAVRLPDPGSLGAPSLESLELMLHLTVWVGVFLAESAAPPNPM